MVRKYEVHIDGRLLIIGGTPDAPDSSEQLLVQEVGSAHEVARAVERWGNDADHRVLLLHGRDVEEVWNWFSSSYVFVQAAGGCVTDEQERLLMIHRLAMWDLPKGKVEEGEAVDAGAVREVREECGLRSLELREHLCATWHTYERKGRAHLKRTDWYVMRGSNREPLVAQTEEDITEVRWFGKDEVRAIRAFTYPSLLQVLDRWEAALR